MKFRVAWELELDYMSPSPCGEGGLKLDAMEDMKMVFTVPPRAGRVD